MKKILVFVFLFSFQWARAQTEPERISISFENTAIIEVLDSIEKKTNYRFYYIDDWIAHKVVSGNYKNTSITDILTDILEKTVVNFYVWNDKIILTQNSMIYDKLPQGFFGTSEKAIAQKREEEQPVQEINPFFNDYNESSEIETERIGKKNKNNADNRFRLSGYVKNIETGKPIANMAIIANGHISAVTNQNGYYEIILPAGSNLLKTRSMGTQSVQKRVILYNNGTLNLNIKESYEQLGEVILEANPDENVTDAITGSEEINVEEIKNIPLVLGVRDIFKVATTLPGISTAGEGASGFNVRGGRADQNLILLDDAVLYNPVHFFGIFSAINPFTTGDVTIYKGSIPAKFGGRLSSVFDIETKDANTQKFEGEASVGPVTSNLALEIPIVKEKSGLIIGGRSTYSNWILRSLDEESLKNSEASFYDLLAKYNHKFNDKNEIKATAYYSHDNFSITSDSLYSYSNRLFSLRYNHEFNRKNQGSIIFSNSNYKFNIDYESDSSNNFTTGYNINESDIKLNMSYLHSQAHEFNYGISGKLYMVNPGERHPLGSESLIEPKVLPDEKGLESAIYISDKFTVNEKLLINAGVRYSTFFALGKSAQRIYEKNKPKNETSLLDTLYFGNNEVIETYGGPEVRVSARYLITPSLSVKVSYNNTFQYIHTLTSNTTMSPTDTYKLSDLNIEPQKSNQYSLGFYKNLDDNTYELSLAGYYKKSKNMLDFKVGAQLFLNENIETEILSGEGKAYGIEFLLRKTKGKLNGWLGYSYSRSFIKLDSEFREERVNNGEYFPTNFDKPHDFSLVANYKLTKRFSFSANFVYQTGRPVTYPIGKYNYNESEYVFYSDRNEFRIPDYYRLDLSFNVEGNHKIKKFAHSFWSISVYNVLGRNNPYSVFFVTEDGDIKALKSSIFSVPIPTITYNFKF